MALTWDDVPMERVSDYARLGYMLEAQERLAFISDVAAGTGSLKKGRGARHIKRLQRVANPRRGKQQGATTTIADLESIGVEVVKVNG